jgi:hypothetical protein
MAVIDDSDPEIAEAATRDAMQAGADVIYQARLSVCESWPKPRSARAAQPHSGLKEVMASFGSAGPLANWIQPQ